jgi:cell division protein FtsW (lipid II flippase)
MYEKIGAAFVMIVTIIAMVFFKGLELPALITVPLVVACIVIYLIGVVFLFAEGTIIK